MCQGVFDQVRAGRVLLVSHRSAVQTLVVQQVLLQDCLLTGQLLLCHLLQRDTQSVMGQLNKVVCITELIVKVSC